MLSPWHAAAVHGPAHCPPPSPRVMEFKQALSKTLQSIARVTLFGEKLKLLHLKRSLLVVLLQRLRTEMSRSLAVGEHWGLPRPDVSAQALRPNHFAQRAPQGFADAPSASLNKFSGFFSRLWVPFGSRSYFGT